MMRVAGTIALLAGWMALAAGCSGAPSDTPTTPTPPPVGTTPEPPAPAPATGVITVSAGGVSPAVLTIAAGTRVTFANTDSRPHDFSGGPNPSTPECPEIDVAGFIAAGQSRQTGVFTTARTCRYHDHTFLGVAAFEGRIVVQ